MSKHQRLSQNCAVCPCVGECQNWHFKYFRLGEIELMNVISCRNKEKPLCVTACEHVGRFWPLSFYPSESMVPCNLFFSNFYFLRSVGGCVWVYVMSMHVDSMPCSLGYRAAGCESIRELGKTVWFVPM